MLKNPKEMSLILKDPKDDSRFSVEPSRGGTTAPKFAPLVQTAAKYAWADLRKISSGSERGAILGSLAHLNFDGVISDFGSIPERKGAVKNIVCFSGIPSEGEIAELNAKADIIVLDPEVISALALRGFGEFTKTLATCVNVTDSATLELAVVMTRHVRLLIVDFKDETKIPLEIVLADAQNHNTDVVMRVKDSREAEVVFGVLECGASGVICEPADLGDLYKLTEMIRTRLSPVRQELTELTVLNICHAGMGDRACLDFTSYLGLDEGVLIGSFSSGLVLACSETHPLPYMPTRPFRVNAGSLHLYAMGPGNRTRYLIGSTFGDGTSAIEF